MIKCRSYEIYINPKKISVYTLVSNRNLEYIIAIPPIRAALLLTHHLLNDIETSHFLDSTIQHPMWEERPNSSHFCIGAPPYG